MQRIVALLTAVGLTALVAGCGEDRAEPEFPNPLLTRVPADTPYLYAGGEPLPEELGERLQRILQENLDNVAVSVTAALEDLEELDPEAAQRGRAIVGEMREFPKDKPELDHGLTREDRVAFYGHGLMPVLRLTVSDPAAFRAFVEELIAAAKLQPEKGEHAGVEYWHWAVDRVRIAAGVDDGVFSIGLTLAEREQRMLSHLFGEASPERSVVDAGIMPALIADHDFLAHSAGYVDMQRLTALLLGDGEDAGLLGDLETASLELSPACRAEVQEIVGKTPRMAVGYTDVGDNHLATDSVVELAPAIAQELQGWTTPVPGLGRRTGAKVAIGYGLDFTKAGSSVQSWLSQAAKREYQCGLLQSVNWQQSANQVNIAPLLMGGNPKGFLMRLDELALPDLAAGASQLQGNIDIQGSVVMLFDQTQSVMAMAKSFVPELQGLDIPSDGTPVAVPLSDERKAYLQEPPAAAMTDTLLGVAVGKNSKARLSQAMQAESNDPPSALHVDFDGNWLYGKLGDLMEELAASSEEMGTLERQELERNAQLMHLYAELFNDVTMRVAFDEQGISFEQTITFQ